MVSSTLLGLLVATLVAQQAPPPTTAVPAPAAPQEKPIAANLKVRVATSVYLTDGRVLTASNSDWPLALNKLVTLHAVTGKTLCEPRPGTLDLPADAGAGWRLQIRPVRESAGELEVGVDWRQISPGQVGFVRPMVFKRPGLTALPILPTTTLKLHPGDRIVLDYFAFAGPGGSLKASYFGQLNTAIRSKEEKLPAAASDCNAVGMTLEIGLEAARTEAVVEAELWLVRPNPDGTERSERQVLRLPVGQPASAYAFDETRLLQPVQGKFSKMLPLAKVFGDLSVLSVGDGKIHLKFNLTRKYELGREQPPPEWTTNSTYRDLVAVPGEVVAFQLPTVDIPISVTSSGMHSTESRPLPQLSVRLRANVVR